MINRKNDSEDFKLKDLMEAAGLTEPELSRRTKVSVPTIAAWKARRKFPRIDNAAIVAKELGVSLKTFFRSFGIDVKGIPDDLPPR